MPENPEAPLSLQLRRRLRFVALLVTIVIGVGAFGTCYVLEVRPTASFFALVALTASVLALLVYVLPLAVVAQMEARNRRLVVERETLAMIERELTAELELDRLLRLIVDQDRKSTRLNSSH